MSAESAATAGHETAICDLVDAARQGEQHAFDQLVELHRQMVYGKALGVLENDADAEDVCQEVFMRAIRRIDQLEDSSRFSGWLETIAYKTALNQKRKRKWEVNGFDEIPEGKHKNDNDRPSPLAALIDEEEREQVRQAVRRLREQDQEILILLYFDGRSLREISCQLEIPLGTVKSRLNAALRRVEKELDSMGFATEEDGPSPYKGRKIPERKCRVTFSLPAMTSSLAWAG